MPTTFPKEAKDAAEAMFKRNPNILPAAVADKLSTDWPGAGITKDVVRNWAARGGWRPGIGVNVVNPRNLPATLGSAKVPAVRKPKTSKPPVVYAIAKPLFSKSEMELMQKLADNNLKSLQKREKNGWMVNPNKKGLSLEARLARNKSLIKKLENMPTE